MNFKSDNNSQNNYQQNTSLDQLMQANEQAMSALELIPYEQITYALPKELREAEMELLEQAVEFQPTLYSMISQTVTSEEMTSQVNQLVSHTERYYQRIEKSLQGYSGQIQQELIQTINQKTATLKEHSSQSMTELTDSLSQAGNQREQNILNAVREIQRYIDTVSEGFSMIRQKIPLIAVIAAAVLLILQPLVCALWLMLLT